MSARAAAKPTPEPAKLEDVFDEFKAILARYAKSFSVREGTVKNKHDYHLIVEKPQVIDGRKRKELWFASVIQQKDSVGFYLTCISDDVKTRLSQKLLKHRDGKCCFHMKTLTSGLKKDVDAALRLGLAEYKKRGWL
jgi:hypothetical protein